MERDEKQTEICTCRGRNVSENLYECNSGLCDYCEHKTTFGKGYYCSLLLKPHSEHRSPMMDGEE